MKIYQQKVLVIIGSLDVGGTEKHLTRVLPALNTDSRQIRVVCFRKGGALAEVLRSKGVEVKCPDFSKQSYGRLKFSRVTTVILAIGFLAREFLSYKPDVAHYFLPEAYILGGLLSTVLGTPYRVMSRRSRNFYQQRSPITRIERLLHGRMDRILTNSTANLTDLKSEGVSEDRLILCYNGIDSTEYDVVASQREMPSWLPIENGDIVVTCVANLIPYKGHADIISALKILENNRMIGGGRRVKILFVGRDSGIQQELESKAIRAGVRDQLVFLGSRADVGEILAVSDIGILASHEEGMSNALLEYMCFSLPIVATDVGGNRETLGDAGRLVPAASPDLMASALAELCNDTSLARSSGERARHRVEDQFPLCQTIKIYSELYDSFRKQPI